MQAGPGVSIAAAHPFDASGAINPTLPALQARQHRQSHRSSSLSSGSMATITRPDSLPRTRPESPGESALNALRDGRESMSHQHKRRRSLALDPSERHSGDPIGASAVNRWSQSTTSSLASNTRRNRSSSGAVLSSLAEKSFSSRQKPLATVDASPRAHSHRGSLTSNPHVLTGSPSRSRRTSRHEILDSNLTALPPLHTTSAPTEGHDLDSRSTTKTLTAFSPQSSNAATEHLEGDNTFSPYQMAKTQRVMMVRNSNAPVAAPLHRRAPSSNGQETLNNTGNSDSHEAHAGNLESSARMGEAGRKPRTKERPEKDKKTMLSKALQKANTAVLLDNGQKYEGALEAYGDACDLLTQVMERTSGDEDKRKLDAIRVTYSNRMEELAQLVQEGQLTSDERDLPPIRMGDDSPPLGGPATGPFHDSAQDHPNLPPAARISGDIPRLSYPRNDRDSFFERTMQAVENSTSFGDSSFGESDMQYDGHSQGYAISGGEEDTQDRTILPTSIQLASPEHSQYVPRPLSPKRPQPLNVGQGQGLEIRQESENVVHDNQASLVDSTSWLDTIDESGSSCSDSVHSLDDDQGIRRKHIRGRSGATDPDFDAAFDAAVEAAYDEGFEPDLEARRKRLTAMRHAHNGSVQSPVLDVNELNTGEYQAHGMLGLDPDEEEEERILDEITHDYGGGFNFDLQTKSALPRQSDSSGYSRSTWQSSQLSDRATAATSLSTVAEDTLSSHLSKSVVTAPTSRSRSESAALPPPTAPPSGALPPPPTAGGIRGSVRSRRLSGLNSKQLKIETSPQPLERRKRASTFHHTASPFAEDEELKSARQRKGSFSENLRSTTSDVQHESILHSPPSLEFHSAPVNTPRSRDEEHTLDYRPSYEGIPADMPAARPTLFRKNKSSLSLRDHTEHTILLATPDPESGPALVTPMSSTFMSFAAKRHQNPLNSQRATLPSLAQSAYESSQAGGGVHLFDTSLSTQPSVSLRSPLSQPLPVGLEPCPDPFLLRPFWLMRGLSQTLSHPRGGFLSTKLFIPREVWQTRGVKLKLVEDKIANCDLLTAALGRLAEADTYDADAVMTELQGFEEVMERVQAALAKKLGSDVGVHGISGMFKDASAATVASAVGGGYGAENAHPDKAMKSNSGKSYLTSWRKLRNKSSGAPLSSGSSQTSGKMVEKEQHTMPSVPMTTFVPVERRGNKREARSVSFEGPNKEYMGSLARLFDGVQVLDQIARQVEDPGLKHSSPTHVGLELSIRHAAEFFGFYICRFVLGDLGLLMDKFLKRGTEWVLA